MSTTLNKAILLGNLVRDPRLDKTAKEDFVCNATVATNDRNDKPQFTDVVIWGKLGELFAQMTKKGSKVYVEGAINTYTNGNITKTEIVVSDFVALDRIAETTAKCIEDSIKL
jgi:single-strand DNA-binding protein